MSEKVKIVRNLQTQMVHLDKDGLTTMCSRTHHHKTFVRSSTYSIPMEYDSSNPFHKVTCKKCNKLLTFLLEEESK